MSANLTIAIPTRNRSRMLKQCLDSMVEDRKQIQIDVVVCDNASTDDTKDMIDREFGSDVSYYRNDTNIGFDGNYMRCLLETKSTHVLVLGDDDALIRGSIGRILSHLKDGADFVSLAPLETDIELSPLYLNNWYGRPSTVWDTSKDLMSYLNASNFEACMGAFISSMVIPRERVLAHVERMQAEDGSGFSHLWGIVPEILSGAKIYWDEWPTFLNRLDNDSLAKADPFERFMKDVRVWAKLGRELMADKPEIRKAFNGIHIRNFRGLLRRNMEGFNHTQEQYREMDTLMKELGY